ncbi:hypothetical protein ACFLTH_13495 [Bacteroidota bacterium]
MKKVHELIETLRPEELLELKKKMDEGSLSQVIEHKLEKFKNINMVCPICNTAVNSDEGLTLIFGPADLKQKAVFDGTDCLEYFLSKLRK